MRRTIRGTRHSDPPHQLVNRVITNGSIAKAAAGVLGWAGFVVALIRCLLSTTHP